MTFNLSVRGYIRDNLVLMARLELILSHTIKLNIHYYPSYSPYNINTSVKVSLSNPLLIRSVVRRMAGKFKKEEIITRQWFRRCNAHNRKHILWKMNFSSKLKIIPLEIFSCAFICQLFWSSFPFITGHASATQSIVDTCNFASILAHFLVHMCVCVLFVYNAYEESKELQERKYVKCRTIFGSRFIIHKCVLFEQRSKNSFSIIEQDVYKKVWFFHFHVGYLS